MAAWRDLEKKSTPRSPRWFLAKYNVAKLHFDRGHPDQAAKIIELVQLLHPEAGGPEMKARFDKLLELCRRPQ